MATPPPSLPKDIKGFCSLTCEPYKQTQPFLQQYLHALLPGCQGNCPVYSQLEDGSETTISLYALLAQHGLTIP